MKPDPNTSIDYDQWLLLATRDKDAEAQYQVGLHQCNVQQDIQEAMVWFQRSADQMHASGINGLAACYCQGGEGVEPDVERAVMLFQKAAALGNPKAQYTLSQYYHHGQHGLAKDDKKFLELLEQSAQQGYAPAQTTLAVAYQTGDGVPHVSEDQALEWFQKAARQGNAEAQDRLAVCWFYGRGVPETNPQEAFVWWERAAAQGHASAQCNLAHCYAQGLGVKVDGPKALALYKTLADQGNAAAQCSLGSCYFNGDFVDRHLPSAVEWFALAAEQGSHQAQLSLGVCYYKGMGVEQHFETAVQYFEQAAAQHNVQAEFNLAMCCQKGEGIDRNPVRAFQLWDRAARQGHVHAQYNLAQCYRKGEGTEKDQEASVEWLTVAATQGHSDAQNTLGVCYKYGQGVDVDLVAAVRWFQQAVTQDNPYAQNELALCYKNGQGVEKDPALAIGLLEKSAAQGNAQAQNNLGYAYQHGELVEKNLLMAIELYEKAKWQGNKAAQRNWETLKQTSRSITQTKILQAFQRVWALTSHSSDSEMNQAFEKEVSGFRWVYEPGEMPGEGQLRDILQSFVTYMPESANERSTKLMCFCLSTFKHTYDLPNGFSFAAAASRGLLVTLERYYGGLENVNLSRWFQFCLWLYIGKWQSIADAKTESTFCASKPLYIDELEECLPYEQVSAKESLRGEKLSAVFVSHRWHTSKDPDPSGDERRIVISLLRQAQVFLDYLIDPMTHPHLFDKLLEGTTVDKLYERLSSLLKSVEVSWAFSFLAHGQSKVLVWYDFFSVPQGKDLVSKDIRARCLTEIDACCRNMPVFAIPTNDFFRRAWCFFECIQATLGEQVSSLRFWHPSMRQEQQDEQHPLNHSTFSDTTDESLANHSLNQYRIQAIHGQFCQLVEHGMETTSILEQLGITCTNEADLRILSAVLHQQSVQATSASADLESDPSQLTVIASNKRWCWSIHF